MKNKQKLESYLKNKDNIEMFYCYNCGTERSASGFGGQDEPVNDNGACKVCGSENWTITTPTAWEIH